MAVGGDLVTAKHEAEEAVEGDKISAESVIGIFAIDDFREVERVNADIGVEREANIAAADGVAELLVFVFWVDNEDLGADHHRAKGFELDGERFTSTGFREDDEVGVF